MKRFLAAATAIILAVACMSASATSTTISGTKTQYPISFPLQSGSFCFNGACATITNGAFSGTFTEATATVTILNGSQTILTIPNVTISTTTYNWDNFVVPASAQISGAGSPTIACLTGAFYAQTDSIPVNQPWTCQTVQGNPTWVGQGPTNTSPSSARYSGAGAPSFSCYAPCIYTQTDASPTSQAFWSTVSAAGFPTSTWVRQNGAGGPVSFTTVTAAQFLTATHCASAAAPAVCGSAASGFVVVAAAGTTVEVDTTAVTANSAISVQEDSTLGTALSVTCNATPATAPPTVSARTAASKFTITTTTPTTNPRCFTYHITD